MRIYNALVVDDEAYIATCVAEMLASAADIDLDVKTALSAREALEVFERERVDILLTDIEMPEISGLDLAARVVERWPICKVLFLTAHSEFEYASRAVKLNAIGYILKTQSDDSIINEVKRAARLIDDELARQARSRQAPIMDDARREKLLALMGESTVRLGELGFSGQNMALVAAGFAREPGQRELYSLKLLMSHYVTGQFKRLAMCERESRAYWLMEDGGARTELDAWLRGMLETVVCAQPNSPGVMIAYQTGLNGEDGARRAFNTLKRALTALKPNSVLSVKREPETPPGENFGALARKLRAGLENGEHAQAASAFEELTRAYRNSYNMDSPGAMATYNAISSMVIERAPELYEKYAAPPCGLIWGEAYDALMRELSRLMGVAPGEPRDAIIDAIKRYINDHAFDGVTLYELSTLTGYNSSYLSRYFAEKCDENISAYIARVKLRGIEALARDSKLSLNDIASAAGFESRSYFNRFIIKLTGLSPNKWRETLS